jgi:hypothetical protein
MPITEWAMYKMINVITGFMCITDDTILGFSTYASSMWITIIINNAHRPNCTPPLLIAIRIIGTDDSHMPNTGIKPHINTMVDSRAIAFTLRKYRQMAVSMVLIADIIN